MNALWQQLDALQAAEALDPIDLQLARLLTRLDGRDDAAVALAAVVVRRAAAAGDVCVDLRQAASQPVVSGDGADVSAPYAPSLDDWMSALRGSPVVGHPGEARPLVLDAVGRLYLHRRWDDERLVAENMRARARAVDGVDRDRLRADLARVFPPATTTPDWQRVAAVTAVLRQVCVIAGGPGTGKTSTVVRVLALLAGQSAPPLKIELAAPTGKAAARLLDAVRRAATELGVLSPEQIPADARTLHRLLGRRPRDGQPTPRLEADVVVVDEASMVDLALMARLLRALSPTARLILLGDKDQLASVEAGAVLADVCGPAAECSPGMASALESILDAPVPAVALAGAPPLQDSIVVLRHSHRFGAGSGIGRLAAAVNAGDANDAMAILLDPGTPDVTWLPAATPAELDVQLAAAVDAYTAFADAVQRRAAPAELFTRFNAARVLCAVRHGPFGVAAINQRLVATLAARGVLAPRGPWFTGRPVLVTQNDYGVRVFNGDVGLALPDDDGRLRVCFEGSDGGQRWIAPVRLPQHETVFAMTVHKAQGSEFDAVTVVLPPEPNRVLTRELLYTALTRARTALRVCGVPAVFADAVSRRAHRASGLRDALWS